MEGVFRSYVKISITLGVDTLTISRNLRMIYGDNAPSHLDIEKWISNEHKESLTNVSFQRPSTDAPLKDNDPANEVSSFLSFHSFISSFPSLLSDLYDTMLQIGIGILISMLFYFVLTYFSYR